MIVTVESGNHNIHPNTSGRTNRPRRWVNITQENVDQFTFGEFIYSISNNIENLPVPDGYDNKRCIMWDNLSLHKTVHVTNIMNHHSTPNNFFIVNRPPYQPMIAPRVYYL